MAAAQAQIKALRDALNAMLTHMGMDEDEWNKPTFDQARNALAQPTDTSALRELLKAERERCAQLCDSIADADPYETNGYGCAAKIRAMGSELTT